MNSLTGIKGRIVQTVVLLSALALVGVAQAQYGNRLRGQQFLKFYLHQFRTIVPKAKSSDDQSKAMDKDAEKEKMERNVKDTIKRDQSHKLKPSEYDPPK